MCEKNVLILRPKVTLFMKKHLFLAGLMMALSAGSIAQTNHLPSDESAFLPLSTNYELTESGYMDNPQETAIGIVLTNNRQSELYVLRDGVLQTLVSEPGCGRYYTLSADKTLLGFKSINKEGMQAPAVLNLLTGTKTLLEGYSEVCGQPSFSQDGMVVYTTENALVIRKGMERREVALDFYSNIANVSPNGEMVAMSNHDGKPIIFDVASGRLSKLSNRNELYNPQWSADGEKVVYEQSNMTLLAYDMATGAEYCLGRGYGAQWLDEETVVFCRPEYKDEDNFFMYGTSICQSRFNGEELVKLVEASQEIPQTMGVTKEKELLIAYSNGARRLVKASRDNVKKETVLYRIGDNETFGYCHPEPARLSSKAPMDGIGGTLDYTDIPYVNQVYDTPDYNGQHAYGPCACAPSTSAMVLGYYGKLTPHPLSSRLGTLGTVNYSWYVGQVYTHPKTGTTFNLTHMSSCGGDAAGGYGYMWNLGSPATQMGNYYKKNDIANPVYDYNGLTAIRQEATNNYPFSWCITSSRSNGHLILPYRSDAAYVKSGSAYSYVYKPGSVVVQDPYGNANNATWVGDGRHATYDAAGYNNGYLQMNNAWGVKIHLSRTASSVTYVLNGGSLPSTAENSYYSDFTPPTPTKDGCSFLGWFTSEDYNTRVTNLYPGCNIETIYALWSDMPLVRYILNGGSLPEGVHLPAYIQEDVTLPTPIMNGYTCRGWFWSTDLFEPVTVVHVGEGGILYALWKKETALEDVRSGLQYMNHVVSNPNGIALRVFTTSGQLLFQTNSDASLENYPAGVYLIATPSGYLKVIR